MDIFALLRLMVLGKKVWALHWERRRAYGDGSTL
jgi:hypothetical protein